MEIKFGEAGRNLGGYEMCYVFIGIVVTGNIHLSKLVELLA